MIYLIAIVAKQYIIQHKCLKKWIGSVGTCEASRFDSNSNRPFRFDSIWKWWADSKIFESAVPAHCSS